jgi:hypothetical protein
MKGSRFAKLLILVIACQTLQTNLADEPKESEIGPIRIVSISVRVSGARPRRGYAHVRGIIGDSCTVALPPGQTRNGNVIVLTLNRQRPRQEICSKIAKVYDQSIELEGNFSPGDYVVKTNNVEKRFVVH